MSPLSKREDLAAIAVRYRRASKKGKTAIRNEFCAACGYHRKHALRLVRTCLRFTQKQQLGEEECHRMIRRRSWCPSNASGWQPICPAQSGSRQSAVLAAGVYQDLWCDLARPGRGPASNIARDN